MSEIVLLLWDFEDAPAALQRLVPQAYAGWWLALVQPGSADEIVQSLVKCWTASGFPIVRHEVGEGVVLAGPHLRA